MFFRFLRKYFHDEEFEQRDFELAQTKQVLIEYKQFIQEQRKQVDEEKEKVDLDFLTLIWASIAVALAFGSEAINHFPNHRISFTTTIDSIWSIFAIAAFVFIVTNLMAAINLTIKYANLKIDTNVKYFAFSLFIGMTILVIGIFIMAWPNQR